MQPLEFVKAIAEEARLAHIRVSDEGAACMLCRVPLDLSRLQKRFGGSDYLCDEAERILGPHWHAPPEPLTPEEREQGRIQRLHRRGAMRCAGPWYSM